MAEARSIAAIGEVKRGVELSVSDDAVTLNFSVAVPKPHVVRAALWAQYYRARNAMVNSLYPIGACCGAARALPAPRRLRASLTDAGSPPAAQAPL